MNDILKSLWVGLFSAVTVIAILFTWLTLAKLGVMGIESMLGLIPFQLKAVLGLIIFLVSAGCTIMGTIAYYEHLNPPKPLTEEEKKEREREIEIEDAARYGY